MNLNIGKHDLQQLFGQDAVAPDIVKHADHLWKFLDELAESSPEEYSKFLETQMKAANADGSIDPKYSTPEQQRFFHPRPGFCVRTSDVRDQRYTPMSSSAQDELSTFRFAAAGQRIYINFCMHDYIPPPRTPDGKIAPSHIPPQFLLVPLSIGPIRKMFPQKPARPAQSINISNPSETGSKIEEYSADSAASNDSSSADQKAFIFDVIFHPSAIARFDGETQAALANPANASKCTFPPFLVELAMQHIEKDNVPVKLSRDFRRLQKHTYRGEMKTDSSAAVTEPPKQMTEQFAKEVRQREAERSERLKEARAKINPSKPTVSLPSVHNPAAEQTDSMVDSPPASDPAIASTPPASNKSVTAPVILPWNASVAESAIEPAIGCNQTPAGSDRPAQPAQKKPLIQEVDADQPAEPPCWKPDYTIRTETTDATSTTLHVGISLPLLTSAAQLDLDISIDRIVLSSNISDFPYSIQIDLSPHRIDIGLAAAKFDKKSHILNIRSPILQK